MDLLLLERPLSAEQIPAILAGDAPLPDARTSGHNAELGGIVEFIDHHLSVSGTKGLEAALAPQFHSALRHLSRRLLLDDRLWNWLAIDPFQRYVVARWHNGVRPEVGSAVAAGNMMRWSFKRSLRGVANHSIARLFWSAQLLGPDDDYDLARAALSKQDLFKNLFERELCLHPPAAKAAVRTFRDGGETDWRNGLKNLNLVLSTTSVEYLDEDEVFEIFNSSTP